MMDRGFGCAVEDASVSVIYVSRYDLVVGKGLSRRIVSAALFAMLVAGLFAGFLWIKLVKAEGTICIRADGSIDPSTAPIFTADKVKYTLTGNITADSTNGVVVQRNNIVLNGAGFAVNGKMLANSNGIVLDRTRNVTVTNVTVESFRNGIYGNMSNGGHITETNLMNCSYGIYLSSSQFNTIDGNNITQNTWAGIWLDISQNNNITKNRLANSITNNFGGIVLHDLSNDNNILENCLTANNRYGIYIENCWSNTIYHNNFTNNLFQAYVDPVTSQTNTWDNGYPSGGNYWNDYNGVDAKSGPKQDRPGSDGIGDTPYILDGNNKDNYPLMQPWTPPPVQYNITFTASGVGSGFTGTVVAIDRTNYTENDLPVSFMWDLGSVHSFFYVSQLGMSGDKRYVWNSTTGLSTAQNDSLTVTGSGNVTGNYVTQYQITLYQTGLRSDFTGKVVTIDGANYNVTNLPVAFWWNASSNHSFSFVSSLTVNSTTRYMWYSTSGLSNSQSDQLTINVSGSIVGNYILQTIVTFDEAGVSPDFAGTLLVVDGTDYNITEFPVSFLWTVGSTHTFAYDSPLTVTANAEKRVWNGTTGLSSAQSGLINATTYGTIVGDYKTQYNLTLATSPSGIDPPSGQGWYDAGSYAPISTTQYVDIVSGYSRYRFNGWTTANLSEITDSSSLSTTVLVDEPKTVTATYATQYCVSFVVTPSAGGLTTPGSNDVWEDAGSLPVSATANSGWTFSLWTSNTSSISFLNSNSSSTMAIINGVGTIVANFGQHDVAVTKVTSLKSVVGRGYVTYINVTVANEGDFTETFNVTVHANGTAVANQQTKNMNPAVRFTLTFTWNTTDLAYGNYTINAYAWPVLGETDTANNNCTCGVQVHVGVPGDVSSSTPGAYDLRVDIQDIAYIVKLFNIKPDSPSWNPNADLNNDGAVNMKDIAIAIAYYNRLES